MRGEERAEIFHGRQGLPEFLVGRLDRSRVLHAIDASDRSERCIDFVEGLQADVRRAFVNRRRDEGNVLDRVRVTVERRQVQSIEGHEEFV